MCGVFVGAASQTLTSSLSAAASRLLGCKIVFMTEEGGGDQCHQSGSPEDLLLRAIGIT